MAYGKSIGLNDALNSVEASERRLVRGLALVAAVISLSLVVNEFIGYTRIFDSASPWSVMIDYTPLWHREKVGLGLLVNLITIWPFRARLFIIPILSLTSVLVEYGLWFRRWLDFKRVHYVASSSSIDGLYLGNGWDVVLIFVVLLLLTWVARIVIIAYFPRPTGVSKS